VTPLGACRVAKSGWEEVTETFRLVGSRFSKAYSFAPHACSPLRDLGAYVLTAMAISAIEKKT
jgi:hypothetical protein